MTGGVGLRDRPHRLQDFLALVAERLRVERRRRLHRHHRQQLQQMVLEDVAQDANGIVEAAAVLDPDRLGGGDLDVIDVVAIPDRLEDAIGEAQDQHVLDGLFAEVVVDAVDLVLAEVPVQGGVELARRFQVAAERLFDDDAAPTVALDGEAGGGQRVDQAGVGRGGVAR